MGWTNYDAWKTDPEYGMRLADMRRAERAEEEIAERLDRADALRKELRECLAPVDLVRLRLLVDELLDLDARLPFNTHADEIDVAALEAAVSTDPTCRQKDRERWS